ncbi:Alpha/Beta hydrolase protein [Limtongia smithiae]|uniref:Alpha/Beta hydrolase protein n=1 Tax=Limtongia smithiae TaxID=1125753 RepID=UPI0034CD46E3
MIDHILGRPAQNVKKVQVLVVATSWLLYLIRGPRHGPPIISNISRFLSAHASAWQIHVLTMTGLYVLKNVDKLLNLQAPEPLAGVYSKSFFRASWILTALDAGFWTAMSIRPKPVQDVAAILFSMYYLVFADQADEIVRKVRATITAEHLRMSWEKANSPILRLTKLISCPRIAVLRSFEISRPRDSRYKTPIKAYLYYDGPRHKFKSQSKLLLDFPGGGFVSMTPRHHDDALCAWAKKLKTPVVSIDYGKAPEHPYPHSLDECYDAYIEIMRTKGRCIGLSGLSDLQIVLTGDSAGGNFVAGTMLKLLTNPHSPKLPISILMVYPALDLNFTSWMTDEQVRLLRQESVRELHAPSLMKRKESIYKDMSGRLKVEDEVVKSDFEEFEKENFRLPHSVEDRDEMGTHSALKNSRVKAKAQTSIPTMDMAKYAIGTSLAMTSRVSYFSDKILSPEMLRAMVILYIGPNNKPDFSTDYLLSPLNAPTELLARFPKVYMICGEVDPLVDDTVQFAGRLREAKRGAQARLEALAMSATDGVAGGHRENEFVEVMLIRGISHGFLQIPMLLPEGRAAISRCAVWIQEAFTAHDAHMRQEEDNYDAWKGSTSVSTSLGHGNDDKGGSNSSSDSNMARPSTTRVQRHVARRALDSVLSKAGLSWVLPSSSDLSSNDSDVDDVEDDDDFFTYGYGDKAGADDADTPHRGELERHRDRDRVAFAGIPDDDKQGRPIEISVGRARIAGGHELVDGRRELLRDALLSATGADGDDNASSGAGSVEDSGGSGAAARRTKNRRKIVRLKSWDRTQLVLETELMERRRNALVRSLAAQRKSDDSDAQRGQPEKEEA